MKPKSKRIMGLLLALVMIIGCIPLNSMKVYAADVYPVEINKTNFPDDEFREIVSFWGDKNHDGWLSKEEAGEPESINNYSGKAPVKDLKGLEYFYNAKEIEIKNAELTNVDLSKNPNLERVILDNNQITTLDISNNLKLKELSLKGNNIDKLSNIKFGYNNALETLNLSENYFTKLDLRNFPNLKRLECSGQKSETELMELLMQSKKLQYLDCSHNALTDLDLTKSTELVNLICNNNSLTSLDFSNSKKIDIFQSNNQNQYYAIGPTFPYPVSKLPGNFNPSYVSDLKGATISGGAFYRQDENTQEITYTYKPTGSAAATLVKLSISGFLGVLEVNDINSKVQEGLTRLTFDAGDGTIDGKPKKALDVNALLEYYVTELQVQIKRMQPIANDPNKVFLDWFPEMPQRGQVGTETYYARYTDKVKVSTDPNAGLLDGYTRIAFDAGEGNTVDGSRYKIIDVVTGTKWNDPALQSKLPQKVICGEKIKEFRTWSQEILSDDSLVGTGLFEARYESKEMFYRGSNINDPNREGYVRLIFDATEDGTIGGKDRYKYIDVRQDLTWNHPKVVAETILEATYKDSTRVFDKWNPEVSISNKKVEKQTFIAVYKDVETGSKVYKFEPTSDDNPVDERDAKIPDKYKVNGRLDTTKYSIISFKLPKYSRYICMGKLINAGDPRKYYQEAFAKSFSVTTSFIIPKRMLWRDFRSDLRYDYENSPVAIYSLIRGRKDQGCQFEFYGFKNGLPNDDDVLNNGRIFEADFRLKEKIKLSRSNSSKIDNYIWTRDWIIHAPVDQGYGRIKGHGNGGTINGKTEYEVYANVAYDFTFEEIIKHLPDPYKEGYKFKYWSESPEEGSPAIDGTKVYNEKTSSSTQEYGVDVYAQYEQGTPDIIENPTKPTPQGYARVTFRAGEGIEKLNSTKFYDVKIGTSLREAYYPEVTLKATHENPVWSVAPGTPINSPTEIVATASLKGLIKIGTDPNAPVPVGYTRITFDATIDGNIEGNRYKVIDVLNGTTWDNQAVTDEIPKKAKYKDATKIFTEWDSTVPTTGPVEEQDFTAIYRTPAPTPDPTNPIVGPVDPQDPNGGKPADPSKYYVVTFVSENENKGTVAKANTVYVPMRAGKTFADLARFAPAAIPYYGYEFAGWSPYLYGNPTIIDSNMVIYARFEELYTPSYPDPYERRRPRRKYNYRDDRYERDDNEEEKIEEAKVYDKLEAILFINNNLMQKSVNGVVSQVRMDIAPFIYQSRTMLPIRFVAESLGFMVTWDANTRTVYLIDKENIVQIPVDTNNIIVNGNTFVSDVKPMIKNNRTMLPVANVARALGLEDGKDILWDAVRAMVTLKRNVLK